MNLFGKVVSFSRGKLNNDTQRVTAWQNEAVEYTSAFVTNIHNKIANEITKIERKNLVRLLKNLEITIKGFRSIDEAIITSGGIKIKEINPKTMESKIIKGLYFAGEIIDVDAYTGGFNLQIAYSTGYTAGNNM